MAPFVVTMAERLGVSSLAAELKMALEKIAAVEPPLVPRVRSKDTSAYLIAPGSYCQWFSVRS